MIKLEKEKDIEGRQLTSWKERFQVFCENDETSFYTSEKQHFTGNNLDFDYQICIKVKYLEEWTGEESDKDKFGFELTLLPVPECLSKRNYEHDKCFVCKDFQDNDILDIYDVSECGHGVELGYATLENISSWNDSRIERYLDYITTVLPEMEKNLTEYFDQSWNIMGTTGWDSLWADMNS